MCLGIVYSELIILIQLFIIVDVLMLIVEFSYTNNRVYNNMQKINQNKPV